MEACHLRRARILPGSAGRGKGGGMTEPVLIANLRKNAREAVFVQLSQFKGHDLLSLRVHYDAGNGEMRPGKDGLAVRVEQLPELREALQAAEAQAQKLGLIPDAGTPA